MVTEEEGRWLGSVMVARMLVDAATAPRQEQLFQAVGFWFPDSNLSVEQKQEVVRMVQREFRRISGAVDLRLEKLIDKGQAKALPGCEGRI